MNDEYEQAGKRVAIAFGAMMAETAAAGHDTSHRCVDRIPNPPPYNPPPVHRTRK